MTFLLPSFDLGTDFDRPNGPLGLPLTLNEAVVREKLILDGVVRGPGRRWRVHKPEALFGVRVDAPLSGLRVKVQFAFDDPGEQMRQDYLNTSRGQEVDRSPLHHRLVVVRVQGVPRAMVLFHADAEEIELPTRSVSLDVSREEIGETGFLVLEFGPWAECPTWANGPGVEGSAVGVVIRRVEVTAVDSPSPGAVMTGRVGARRRRYVASRPGFFVVNPAAQPCATTVHLKSTGATWSATLPRLRAEAVTISGATVMDQIAAPDSSGGYHLSLPKGREALCVRLRILGGEADPDKATGWFASVVH